jgi:hypothetical protein
LIKRDTSVVVGDGTVTVDGFVAFSLPDAIEPGSRRKPPESMTKWTLSNAMSTSSGSPKGAERDALVCGVNSRGPQRIEFLGFDDDGVDGIDKLAKM